MDKKLVRELVNQHLARIAPEIIGNETSINSVVNLASQWIETYWLPLLRNKDRYPEATSKTVNAHIKIINKALGTLQYIATDFEAINIKSDTVGMSFQEKLDFMDSADYESDGKAMETGVEFIHLFVPVGNEYAKEQLKEKVELCKADIALMEHLKQLANEGIWRQGISDRKASEQLVFAYPVFSSAGAFRRELGRAKDDYNNDTIGLSDRLYKISLHLGSFPKTLELINNQ